MRQTFSRRSRRDGVGEKRIHRGTGIQNGVFARLFALRGRFRRRFHIAFRKPVELVLCQIEHVALFIVQQVVAEFRIEVRKPLVDFGHYRFELGSELCALAEEIRIVIPYQPLLLRRKPGVFPRVVYLLDALKQSDILHHGVAVLGKFRLHLLFHRPERIRRHIAGPHVVDSRYTIQRFAAALHRGDRIFKSRRLRVGGDLLHLHEPFRHRRFERGLEMLHLHPAKRRNSSIWTAPFSEENVLPAG